MTEQLEQIEALPTVYRSAFGLVAAARSRLEVRWMVCLDALGIVWEYECARFGFGPTVYVPDLYLHSLRAWVEIKPAGHEPDHFRYGTLARTTGEPVLLVCGLPKLGHYTITLYREGMPREERLRWAVGRRDHSEIWLCSEQSGIAVCLSERSSKANWPVANSYPLKQAYLAAMSYRFPDHRAIAGGTGLPGAAVGAD